MFSRRLIKPQHNCTTTKKELFVIVERLNQFLEILFDYEINVFSDHKNLVYAANLNESQRMMSWRLIIEEFEANIQHIAGVDNIVAGLLSKLQYEPVDKYETITRKAQCRTNKLFTIFRE